MDSKIYFLIVLFFGWTGIHKFMSGKKAMGFLYLFTLGLYGIGWIVDVINALKHINNPPIQIDHQLYQYTMEGYEADRIASSAYFKTLDDIESMWAVISNLKLTSGPQVDAFVEKCYENIEQLHNMIKVEKMYGYNSHVPRSVPAYKRLAMLYEKQGDYQNAINICVDAIGMGAVNDDTKGKMYGRLARLISKSGLEVSDEIKSLTIIK